MAILPIDIGPISLGLDGRNALNYARNGVVPSGFGIERLAKLANCILARRTKTLFSNWIYPSHALGNTPADTTVWRFACHTSPAANRVRAIMVTIPANSPDRTSNPRGYWTTQENLTGAGTTTTQPNFYRNDEKTAAAQPDDFNVNIQEFSVTADTDYRWSLHVVHELGLIGATITELPRGTLDTATDTAAVDNTKLIYNAKIHDAPVLDLINAADKIWRRSAPQIITWTRAAATSVTTTSATYVNLLDATVTSRTTTSPGFYTWPRYRHSLDSTNVPVVCYAYAAQSAGSGGITFIGANGTIASIVISGASGTWYSTTGNLLGTDSSDKIDVHIKSNGTATLSVDAVGMFYHVA